MNTFRLITKKSVYAGIGLVLGIGASAFSFKAKGQDITALPPLLEMSTLQEGVIQIGDGIDTVKAEFFSPPFGQATATLIVNPDLHVDTFHMRTFARTAARRGYAVYVMRNFLNNPYWPTNREKAFRLASYLRSAAPAIQGMPAELAARHILGIPTFVLGHGHGAQALSRSRMGMSPNIVNGVILFGAVHDFLDQRSFPTRTTYAWGQLDNRVEAEDYRIGGNGRIGTVLVPGVNHSCITTEPWSSAYMDLFNIEQDTAFDPIFCSQQLIYSLELNFSLYRLGAQIAPLRSLTTPLLPGTVPMPVFGNGKRVINPAYGVGKGF